MNINELTSALKDLGIPPNYFSILEGLKPDSIILDFYHGIWKVFYFSERGQESDEHMFSNEEEACMYVYNKFKKMKESMEGSINNEI
ncbi:MAG TPA: hypothetical protein PKC76_13875 [Saprospiraceae bacterium]|nr:hypothetical protein [Saprospiraceae bacterium]HMP25224.1 hypothetical protein [Saprospiraceae bacterium]